MKYRIRKTGEIVDVISYSTPFGSERSKSDAVSFIDSKGVEHHSEKLNIYWDLEELAHETKFVSKGDVDWEKRRYEVAKEMLPILYPEYQEKIRDAISVRYSEDDGFYKVCIKKQNEMIADAVYFADLLVKELKKGNDETKR